MKIIFAIPTFNRSAIVSKTLPQNISIAKKYGAEIVLIDNASIDSTLDVLSSYQDCIRILSNEKNIGLKGSLRRIILEECNSEVLVIILSDEDLIYEEGLKKISQNKKDLQRRYTDSVLIFNCKNQCGRDYYPRRKVRQIQSWRDVEVFSFGLISGFGFLISEKTASKINWHQINDDRNTYPHWGLMFDCGIDTHVIGVVISRLAVQAKTTNLDQEWRSRKSHWASETVNDYLLYHAENYKSMDASMFRIEYHCVGIIKERRESNFRKLISLIVLFVIAPGRLFYYFLRLVIAFYQIDPSMPPSNKRI